MAFEPVVAELMTSDPSFLTSTDRIRTAAREMELCSIRHLPVVDDDGILIGLISQRDVLACDDPDLRVGAVMSKDVQAGFNQSYNLIVMVGLEGRGAPGADRHQL